MSAPISVMGVTALSRIPEISESCEEGEGGTVCGALLIITSLEFFFFLFFRLVFLVLKSSLLF